MHYNFGVQALNTLNPSSEYDVPNEIENRLPYLLYYLTFMFCFWITV